MQFMQESVHTYYAICLCMWMMLGRNCFWKNAMKKHQKPSYKNVVSHCAYISAALKLSKILQWLCHRLCFGNYPVPVFAVQLTTHTEVFSQYSSFRWMLGCYSQTSHNLLIHHLWSFKLFCHWTCPTVSLTPQHTQDQNYKIYVKSKQQQQHRNVWIKIIHTAQTDLYRETSNTDLVLLTWKTEK